MNEFERLADGSAAEELFRGIGETMVRSALENVMGTVYSDGVQPTMASILLGDFCFFSESADADLMRFTFSESGKKFLIAVPFGKDGEKNIYETFGERARRVTRYAFKKNTVFDREKLRYFANSLGSDFEMRKIDRELFYRLRGDAAFGDFVAQFEDYDMFSALGTGIIVMKNDLIVSGASAYSAYRGGIEIEVDTASEYRRMGLARASSAALILECLDRGLYPSWDAQNPISAHLASALGYGEAREYFAYEISK